jgi:hypothetical protein
VLLVEEEGGSGGDVECGVDGVKKERGRARRKSR